MMSVFYILDIKHIGMHQNITQERRLRRLPLFYTEPLRFLCGYRQQLQIFLQRQHSTGNLAVKSREKLIRDEICTVILSGDFSQNDLFDMRRWNKSEKCAGYKIFFQAMKDMIEAKGTAAERIRKSNGDKDRDGGVSYQPLATSINDLKCQTNTYIFEQKIEGSKEPSNTWITYQFVPNNVHIKMAERYTGIINIKRHCQVRNGRSFHAHAHWNMKFKKLCKEELIMLRICLEEASRQVESNNLDEFLLHWTIGLVALGQDDKTSVPVSRTVPVAAVQRQSGLGINPVNAEIIAADHDFTAEKFVPSVTHYFNIGKDMGSSLFSGGEDGNGIMEVSIHDHTFKPLNVFAHMTTVLLELERRALQKCNGTENSKKFMPYFLFMEADGGPDHNITFVRSKLAVTALWLVTGIDRIASVRCCAGWSALNTAEKGMGLLNMGWSNSAFSFPDYDKLPPWFWKLIKPMNSMATVRKEINTYDREFSLVVNLKKRKLEEKK